MTLYKFIFTFCHSLNNTHSWPKNAFVGALYDTNPINYLAYTFLCHYVVIAEHGNNGGYEACQGHRSQTIPLCPVDLCHKELEIMQFSRPSPWITQKHHRWITRTRGHLSLNCTGFFSFAMVLKLVKALCPWCKVKWTMIEELMSEQFWWKKLVAKENIRGLWWGGGVP